MSGKAFNKLLWPLVSGRFFSAGWVGGYHTGVKAFYATVFHPFKKFIFTAYGAFCHFCFVLLPSKTGCKEK